MRYSHLLLALFLALSITMISCDKEETDNKDTCTLTSENITVTPFCNFYPPLFTTVPFPVRVLEQDSLTVKSPDYTFSWSSDNDFQGSAISVTYEQLPLTVTITEVATGCTASATLDTHYWD